MQCLELQLYIDWAQEGQEEYEQYPPPGVIWAPSVLLWLPPPGTTLEVVAIQTGPASRGYPVSLQVVWRTSAGQFRLNLPVGWECTQRFEPAAVQARPAPVPRDPSVQAPVPRRGTPPG